MRSNAASAARSCLIGLVIAGMLNLPVMGASSKPLGMIVIADHARLDSANAAMGTDLFPGDVISTEANGSVRISVGASQVYLLSSTAATLIPGKNGVQAKLTQGTLGFSTSAPDQLEIGTPLVVIRGVSGHRVFAQVAVLSATELRVSAFEGSLVATAPNGDQKTIDEGETYDATAASADPVGGPNKYGVGSSGINWKHVAFVAGALVTFGLVSYFIWHHEEESCTTPRRPGHHECDSDSD